MGTPVPPEWPDLIDDKWYRCTAHLYFKDGYPATCDDTYHSTLNCCQKGSTIKNWQDLGYECTAWHPICGGPDIMAQKLICVTGPYDSAVECYEGWP